MRGPPGFLGADSRRREVWLDLGMASVLNGFVRVHTYFPNPLESAIYSLSLTAVSWLA